MTAQQGAVTAGGAQLVGAPGRPADYWERVEHGVFAAPPLADNRRAIIPTAIHTSAREAM